MMEFNENTKLADILAAYPWLPETVVQLDPRFKILNTPIGRALIKHATLTEVSKRSGFPVEEVIAELKKLIEAHEGEGNGEA